MSDELLRLRAALAAIHNHLHVGNVNAAHEACECAMSGALVSQSNLTVPQSARVQMFAVRFNAMCEELEMRAAFMALLPSATVRGATSIQVGGEVQTCKMLEKLLGRKSIYQGEHAS